MQRPSVTISTLPPDTLLEIFKFYVDQDYDGDAWYTLVHVCQEWRDVVFSSPRWLHLEFRCTHKRPVKMPRGWPALPIVIDVFITHFPRRILANVIAALMWQDLVRRIKIRGVPNSLFKSAAMMKRFPKLTDLMLHSYERLGNVPIITNLFLGGSAPRLLSLEFIGIPFPFPALGKLLSSAADLVTLRLLDIPNSGFISPEKIVTTLSTLAKLQTFSIGFRTPRSRADREHRHPRPLKRPVLLSLIEFSFKGDSEYLEGIVGRIDAPALDRVNITFFNQLVFNTPLLRDFFSRTKVFQEHHRADVFITRSRIEFSLSERKGTADRHLVRVGVLSKVLAWQLSSLAQFSTTSLPPLPTLECLGIHAEYCWEPEPTDDMENAPWLELLHSFATVKDLAISRPLLRHVAPIVQELTRESVTEALPALQQVFEELSPPIHIRQEFCNLSPRDSSSVTV